MVRAFLVGNTCLSVYFEDYRSYTGLEIFPSKGKMFDKQLLSDVKQLLGRYYNDLEPRLRANRHRERLHNLLFKENGEQPPLVHSGSVVVLLTPVLIYLRLPREIVDGLTSRDGFLETLRSYCERVKGDDRE